MKLFAAMILAVMLTGCVFQPIHVELYNSTSLRDAEVAVDASRNVNAEH